MFARCWIKQFSHPLFQDFPTRVADDADPGQEANHSPCPQLMLESCWLAMASLWKGLNLKNKYDMSCWTTEGARLPFSAIVAKNLMSRRSNDCIVILARGMCADTQDAAAHRGYVVKCSRLTGQNAPLREFQELIRFDLPPSTRAAYKALANPCGIHTDPRQKHVVLHDALQELVAYRCLSQHSSNGMYGYAFVQDLQGCWWVLMALKNYQGGTLHDYIRRRQPNKQEMVALLTQARLLKFQGQYRWSHNDFKADNIMVSPTAERWTLMRDVTGSAVPIETFGVTLHAIDFAWSSVCVSDTLRITSRAPLEFLTQPMCLKNDHVDMAQLVTSICRIYPPCAGWTRIQKRPPLIPAWYFGDSFYDKLSWETTLVEITE